MFEWLTFMYFWKAVNLTGFYMAEILVFKVGLSPSKKICVICFIESSFKRIKNAFNLILKALSLFKIFKFLSWLFGDVEKTAWLERQG